MPRCWDTGGLEHNTAEWESPSTGGSFARKDALLHGPVILVVVVLTSLSPLQRQQ